jgi:probable S-adenosylmethionine-dependent methyltransferase, YraL family
MGKLYLVPTPIGNLEDITLRAIRILKEVDIVLAEDTRNSINLLRHYDIPTPLKAYHAFNEHEKLSSIVELIKINTATALVTDAGTPGISDPGFLLVRQCLKEGIEVESLPGATAFVPALINSGLPCDRFYFEGFLPHKKGKNSILESLKDCNHTMIFYESPFRLIKTLEMMAEHFSDQRLCSVSREITKLHEETLRGSLSEIIELLKQKDSIKGEIVIIIEGKI